MKLSIVIVNYNVKYFLEQCIHSVLKACRNISSEIFVIDNASVDGSCAMIKDKFPNLILIENKENLGFSKANNQAIRLAKGEYILLLNPDTVVDELCFEKVISFADTHPDAGGIGVKMIDGKGKFLPESKRAFPSPSVSFFKIFGLSKIFPRSPIFARYHLGHLHENENHEVEILAGAFMFMRKETLDRIGLLDESFFMYGEDIDLSYRIIRGGYKNYYLADPAIIHYKGESTKKGSINYVLIFYQAMIIFARKHFSSQKAGLYIALIQFAIYLRAAMAIVSRFAKRIALPTIDFTLLYSAYRFLLPVWEQAFFEKSYYPPIFIQFILPAYILIWIFSAQLYRAYRHPYDPLRLLKGLAVGTIFILVIYGLLPEDLRFSRALILMGAFGSFLILPGYRWLLNHFRLFSMGKKSGEAKRMLLIAGEEEAKRIKELINQTNIKAEILGLVSPDDNLPNQEYLGNKSQLHEIVEINKIDELIFSGKDVSSLDIIRNMHILSDIDLDFKIAPPESISVIGSNSIDTAGELYIIDNNSIHKPENQRKKRWFDFLSAAAIILSYPLWYFLIPSSRFILKNTIAVLRGKLSWVGYYTDEQINTEQLQAIKKGVLSPKDGSNANHLNKAQLDNLNVLYSKDYRIITDIKILWKGMLAKSKP